MTKQQWIVTFIAIMGVVGLYSLPKSILSNKKEPLAKEAEETTAKTTFQNLPSTTEAEQPWTPEEIKKIQQWRLKVFSNLESKNSIIFADSMVSMFLTHGKPDSAVHYARLLTERNKDAKVLKFAGDVYYQLYLRTEEQVLANQYLQASQKHYTAYLDMIPTDNEAKNNLALTYVVSDTPMKGIGMLKEILENDPKNETALLNLGILSMQSGQWQKAVERFETLLSYNKNHGKAAIYLANAYLELGEKEKAGVWLDHVIKNSKYSEEVAAAQNLKLKNKL